ncbi:hypothetical protein JQ297_06690 [Helicobacter pylori]|uniref:hypothetical protein n=1 Tax=Helicobacter pylori TaxID=210 RepID=UPI0019330330|nr:hypothetical protein [Helicobacter pylori]
MEDFLYLGFACLPFLGGQIPLPKSQAFFGLHFSGRCFYVISLLIKMGRPGFYAF